MADTTIKITEEVRDRIRTLAEERGLSTRAYIERTIAATPTADERAERTTKAIAYVRANFGVDLGDGDLREGEAWREAIATRQVGSRR
ncbi:hypothetical protein [Streptomyces formicae]|uniref:Ribbon-helix-helix protein CopG domain-containing protein n=1 Tax=Streptomyces formicae TaxID=1616117 RepID=A0ABY3WRW0_9ACTN|nr:hypothetical protein [Streptomyces formicae]UNM14845.1 hypothetical protein J4032_28285 [Streptomyces formicae]